MKKAIIRWVWSCCTISCLLCLSVSASWASKLEDMLLENKQITVDQWIQLKAEEEQRLAKQLEESRGVGDTPVRERWYEKISVRGYAQFRYNHTIDNDLLRSSNLDDRSIAGNNEFFIRRARLVFSGQPHDRVFIYIQPEFAGLVGGTEQVVVLRDFYTDLFLTESKEWRIRLGASKIPFGFENMQSSQNRIPLDRDVALNSIPNQRDLGVFLYYAPTSVRERFRRLVDSGLKGSGDFGMLGIGVFNGQGINFRDRNKDKHIVFHAMYPFEFPNGQILQVGMDAYRGQFNVATTPVVPNLALNNGQAFTPRVTNNGNYLDERIAWHVTLFPQPFGFQAEYMIGRGPELNADRTDIVLGTVRGGYLQVFYRYECDSFCQSIYPFFRVQEFFGGQKFVANSPRNSVREWELGFEYQLNRAMEFTVSYSWTQGNTTDSTFLPTGNPPGACGVTGSGFGPCIQTPYQLQSGNLLRFQLQWNF